MGKCLFSITIHGVKQFWGWTFWYSLVVIVSKFSDITFSLIVLQGEHPVCLPELILVQQLSLNSAHISPRINEWAPGFGVISKNNSAETSRGRSQQRSVQKFLWSERGGRRFVFGNRLKLAIVGSTRWLGAEIPIAMSADPAVFVRHSVDGLALAVMNYQSMEGFACRWRRRFDKLAIMASYCIVGIEFCQVLCCLFLVRDVVEIFPYTKLSQVFRITIIW